MTEIINILSVFSSPGRIFFVNFQYCIHMIKLIFRSFSLNNFIVIFKTWPINEWPSPINFLVLMQPNGGGGFHDLSPRPY